MQRFAGRAGAEQPEAGDGGGAAALLPGESFNQPGEPVLGSKGAVKTGSALETDEFMVRASPGKASDSNRGENRRLARE